MGIALIGSASIVGGLIAVYYFVTPTVIPHVGTWGLLVVLALFVLPLAVVACWRWDKSRQERDHHRATSESAGSRPSPDAPDPFVRRAPSGPSTSQWAEGRPPRRVRLHHEHRVIRSLRRST